MVVTNRVTSSLSRSHKDVWYLYIAIARTGRYYTGISRQPEERVKTHNKGYGSKFAMEQGPLDLVYVSPPLKSKTIARKYEIKIKDWSQTKKKKLISGEWHLL